MILEGLHTAGMMPSSWFLPYLCPLAILPGPPGHMQLGQNYVQLVGGVAGYYNEGPMTLQLVPSVREVKQSTASAVMLLNEQNF